MEYVSRLSLDPRLQALLAPGPELKTTADYMDGIFTYKFRRDILASRAQHMLPSHSQNNETENNTITIRSQNNSPNNPALRDVDKSLNTLNIVSSSNIDNSSSLSKRVISHDTSLNNKSNCTQAISRSSSYLGASPAHLSSANQVANFTSISSPIRPHDTKSRFIATRSLSSPEHPNAFNSSLSSPVVNEANDTLTNGEETFASDEPRRKTSDRSPLPSDSAYFTSESKARLLTRLRSPSVDGGAETGATPASPPTIIDHHALQIKKEELMSSIGRKLEILRAEQEAIKDEVRLNNELGAEVTERVEQLAKTQETEKYKLHVEEIEKITSLLLGLSGRLARAENALLLLTQQDGPELKMVLEQKRDRLSEQLQEALLLKENIDRRATQVEKTLMQYLTDAEFADYDHFIKMKTKLVMDAREITDKIKLGEEQTTALRDTFKSADNRSFKR
uniref:Protein Shroom2 n=1 Tax=Hirondellea gigas TaxID=1518452 RepID=A0A6A7FQ77_9CRUS